MPGTGAYYWLPVPTDPGHHWVVYTSRDAGLDPDVGHTELWCASGEPQVTNREGEAHSFGGA